MNYQVLTVLMLFIALWGATIVMSSNASQQKSSIEEASAKRDETADKQHSSSALNRTDSTPYPSEAEHRAAEQFNWKRQNTIAGCALAASMVAAAFAGFAFYESRRQANAAFFNTRAWMDVKADGSSISIDWNGINGPTFALYTQGTNVGSSPALDATVFPDIEFETPISVDFVRRKCASKDGRKLFNQTVFTKESIPSFADTISTGWNDIRDIQKRHHVPPTILSIDFIICATYRIVGDESWHHTGRAYMLIDAINPATPGTFVPIVGKNMRAGTLALMPEFQGNYAD